MTGLFDSHAHLNNEAFKDDIHEVIARMKAAGMAGTITVACDDQDLIEVTELVEKYPGFIWGAWALHPEYAGNREPSVEEIAEVASRPGMVAVGETGLDYYWHKDRPHWQTERFIRHIEAAKLAQKPLIIHARDAEAESLDILEAHGAGDLGFVMHCYTGNMENARRAVDLGGHVSFTGSLTFKRNDTLREISLAIPLDRLLLETDCPFMAPVPHRGRRCEPTMTGAIAQCHADLRGLSVDDVIAATTANTRRLFNLP